MRRLHAAPTAPKADPAGPYSPCSRLGPLEHREGEGLGAHFPHAKRNDEGSWANALSLLSSDQRVGAKGGMW